MRKSKQKNNADIAVETGRDLDKKAGKKQGFMKRSILLFALIAAAVFIIIYLRTSVFFGGHEMSNGIWPILICAIGSIVMVLLFEAYLYFEERELLKNNKKLLAVGALILLSTLLNAFTTLISYAFTAVFISIILCGLLVSKRTSYTLAIFMAFVCLLMSIEQVGNGAMDKPSAVALAVLVGGIVSVFMLSVSSSRTIPIIAGAVGGLSGAFIMVGVLAICGAQTKEIFVSSAWMLAGGVLCGIIATGLLPVFENVFDIATDARLNELMNNNNPLLKRLMIEAPGTYHHSLIVGVLAEGAAEIVGANALLCKTAAYYHDVGKLTSPRYFKENQGEYNIHDDMAPEESAKRIIAHQRDGAALLEKKHFPSELIEIAGQHHGDSVMNYFYSKALDNASDPSLVKKEDFCYGGHKPHTKEGAILMLADCCEAAVRSLKRPTAESIEERVRSIIRSLWQPDDAQLSECPLTANDIRLIEKSFISNLIAQYHERIEYPANKPEPAANAAANEPN